MTNSISKTTVNEWKEHLSRRETISNILESAFITGYALIRVERDFLIDGDRICVIAIMMNIATGLTERFCFDYRNGKPAYNQVMDMMYDIGKDCSKRLVLYNLESYVADYHNHELPDDVCTIQSFISIVNDYGLNFHLAEVKIDDSGNYEYDFVDWLSCRQKHKRSQLPSEEKFREAEFWVCYYDATDGSEFNMPPASEQPAVWIDYKFYRDEYQCKTTYKWTDMGLFLIAKPSEHLNSGNEFLEYLYEEEIVKLHKLVLNFQACVKELSGMELSGIKIRLREKAFKQKELVVQLTDLSFDEMLNATADDKFYVTGEMYKTIIDFDYLTDEVYQKLEQKAG